MNDGELHARHYRTGRPVRAQWAAGRFTAVTETPDEPPAGLWLAPPLLDLQINGYAGVDFQQDDLEPAAFLHAARRLRADGCAHFFPTLITDEWPRLMARFRHLCALRRESSELQDAIPGWHLEGPFLSAEPGFHGAHDPARMIDPRPEHLHELRALAGSTPLLLTLAPERSGAMEATVLARALGIVVSLGHTNAPAPQLAAARAAGATAFTHLGNACPQTLDRHDNILWRALDAPCDWISLIPDGLHVSPALFRLMHRLHGDRLYYTTDAMSAAGAPPGRYRLGPHELEVGPDRVVRQPGRANFAGSALTPVAGVFTAARMLGCPWQETWRRFSEIPAAVLGWNNSLAAGRAADFCRLQFAADEPGAATVSTFIAGNPAGETRASTVADAARPL